MLPAVGVMTGRRTSVRRWLSCRPLVGADRRVIPGDAGCRCPRLSPHRRRFAFDL